MKIEIKSRCTNGVLFAHEQENNTVRITLELAITSNTNLRGANLSGANLYGANLYDANLSGANLRGANLRGANLSGASLRGANLYDANLSGANLRGANLSGASLSGADLSGTNLSGADLSGADLSGADLSGASLLCAGDMHRIFTIQLDTWRIGFTKDTLQIGCQRYLIEKWKTFDDETINKMDDKALEWWNKWKDHIFKTIELCFGEC